MGCTSVERPRRRDGSLQRPHTEIGRRGDVLEAAGCRPGAASVLPWESSAESTSDRLGPSNGWLGRAVGSVLRQVPCGHSSRTDVC